MQTSSQPKLLPVPFADAGSKQNIPNDSQIGITAGRASYVDGFPPLTRTPLAAGGVPPFGTDFNGVLNDITAALRWSQAGSGYPFNADFNTAISGYPKGARIPNSTLDGFWLNTTDGNSTNPENTTSALTGWVPSGFYGTTAITGLSGSSITLTTLQAGRDRITLAGTLTANINLIVPAWVKRWEVVNNCSGAFSVTVKTPSGTGVAVPAQNNAFLQGDGVNINQSASPGSLIRVQAFTASGTYTPTPGTKKAIVRGVGGGGGGGGCPATTSSQQSTSGGGQSGAYAELSLDSLLSSYAITVGSAGTAGTKTPTAGGNGGATIMAGVVTIPGGAGGYAGSAVTPTISVGSITNGTVYPTVTSGALRIAFPASAGQPALILGAGTNQAKGGVGGSSPFGVGGQGGLGGAPGSVGLGYGAAGGGCSQLASNNGDVGGPGTSGYLEIWEYA